MIPTIEELTSNTEFQAWCRIWERDGKCPVPMIDWLLENYGEEMAIGARWCVNEPDRDYNAIDGKGGVRPFKITYNDKIFYKLYFVRRPLECRSDLPYILRHKATYTDNEISSESFSETIAKLLIIFAKLNNTEQEQLLGSNLLNPL